MVKNRPTRNFITIVEQSLPSNVKSPEDDSKCNKVYTLPGVRISPGLPLKIAVLGIFFGLWSGLNLPPG